MNRRDRNDNMSGGDGNSSGGGRGGGAGGGNHQIHHLPGGRGLGGGCWLSIIGLPRDWREMDVFRAMEKRYGKVNQVRRGPSNEREALVQFVADSDAKFVWHMREIELYDRNCTVDVHNGGGSSGSGGKPSRRMDDSPPPIRNSMGYSNQRIGGQNNMRRMSPERPARGGGDFNNGRSFGGSASGRSFENGSGGNNNNNNNGSSDNQLLPEEDDKATRTLFVGNLESSVTESLLRSTFSKYGLVQDVDVKRPMGVTGNAYAFVRFLTLDMAYEAKCKVNGTRIGNYQCKIGYGKTNPTTRVWVGQLHYPGTAADLDEARLFNEFDRFGQIKKIDYVRGEHYGYITFTSTSASQEAVTTMRGTSFKINGDRGMIKVKLRVDYADEDDPYLPKLSKEKEAASKQRRTTDSSARRAGSRDNNADQPRRSRRVSRSKSGSPPPREAKRRQPSVDAESEPENGRTIQKRTRTSDSPPPKSSPQKAPEDRSGKSRDDRQVKSTKSTNNNSSSNSDASRRKVTKETVEEFKQNSDTVWKGTIMLKSTAYPVDSHLLRGPLSWLNDVLAQGQELQITRRLRLEEEKLKDVTDKMHSQESATLMCFDGKADKIPSGSHAKTLKHLQNYLLEKEAAGVINANQAIIYIFPTCGFAARIIGEDMPTLVLPESGASVKEDNLGLLMVVSNPQDLGAGGTGGGGAE